MIPESLIYFFTSITNDDTIISLQRPKDHDIIFREIIARNYDNNDRDTGY